MPAPPLAADPPPPVDPAVDADPPVDAVPAADPYPFVFGPTSTLQNVAVISSMQKVPVVGACDGAGWLPRLPSSSWPFGVATCCWPFDVPTCAETGDNAGNTIAISATTNATFFMCAAICFMDVRFFMGANVFIVPCPSPLPWEHRRSRDTRCRGKFSPGADVGGTRSARGCPGLPQLKSGTDGLVPAMRLKGPIWKSTTHEHHIRGRVQTARFCH